MINIKHKKFIFGILLIFNLIHSRAPINLFWPSDRPMLNDNWRSDPFQFTVAYEGALSVHGYLADEDENCSCLAERRVNSLQLWDQDENLISGLFGADPASCPGITSQLFNQQGNNGSIGRFRPCGDFSIPLNLMFAARWYFKPCFSLALYLPVYSMELRNVGFYPIAREETFESVFVPEVLENSEIIGDLSLNGWKRTGIGDLVSEFIWMQDFAQAKPFLRNVRLQTRCGLVFPTGKERDEDRLLAFEFGNDGAWAGIGAAGIDLTFGQYIKAGLDVEFMYIFGHTKNRRIKIEESQTDLLFLNKACAYKDSGITQQFNLYLDIYPHVRGSYFKINYQYLTQNDSRLYLSNLKYDPRVVNSAENLQDWSTHSMIFFFNYDFLFECLKTRFLPTVSLFYKKGFNGKRALLADTLGFRFSLNF